MSEIFDFGFTAVNEDELEVTQTMHTMVNEAKGAQEKLDALYNAIVPLLNNLKQNPEKEYIKWPDRLSKVEQFETHLQKIYKGS
jgi:hypothetical protein